MRIRHFIIAAPVLLAALSGGCAIDLVTDLNLAIENAEGARDWLAENLPADQRQGQIMDADGNLVAGNVHDELDALVDALNEILSDVRSSMIYPWNQPTEELEAFEALLPRLDQAMNEAHRLGVDANKLDPAQTGAPGGWNGTWWMISS